MQCDFLGEEHMCTRYAQQRFVYAFSAMFLADSLTTSVTFYVLHANIENCFLTCVLTNLPQITDRSMGFKPLKKALVILHTVIKL